MTVMYLGVRYIGMIYAIICVLVYVPTISVTDTVSHIMSDAIEYINDVANIMLGVIMIVRLYAMYQKSRRMLIFLVVVFLAIRITIGVMIAITVSRFVVEERVFSGNYECTVALGGSVLQVLNYITWILLTVWEVLTLCLTVWIALKHFRELRQQSSEGIIMDCFTILMKTHVTYFASFVVLTCIELIGYLSPTISVSSYSTETQIYSGFSEIFMLVQMFILGPRLILSIREYHARLVAQSDAATAVASINFQESVSVN
ncbi:uncharacterized protein HD556DRAFT_1522289 [Suillus plorans]|uniref:Uncharacterized protein n=1 Tax=Suillus plorans TaxID=116603 RepID=A0A9P7E3E1_9AGAM|nr:uncharacterized protein HD556DRAFT_1522289 [Suillus plorans]KAG1809805.1 hypothetical protein HD556DRAFT_1522289 [Suillus plorans]